MMKMVMWCDVKVRMIWYYNFLLKISLGRMILDICKFCCLYLLVLFAFSCGDLDDGDDVDNDSYFDGVFSIFINGGLSPVKLCKITMTRKTWPRQSLHCYTSLLLPRYEPVAVVLRRIGTAALSWGGNEQNPGQSCWTTLNAVSETTCTQLIGQERQIRSGPWIKV